MTTLVELGKNTQNGPQILYNNREKMCKVLLIIYEWKEVFFSFGENSLPKAPGAGKVTIK
jgi:hypothetical protein